MAWMEVSMSSKRYTDEFRAEAVKQVLDRGHTVTEVAQRLGVHKHSLYEWVRVARVAPPAAASPLATPGRSESAEVRRLRADLKRVTEERDILKKAAAYFAKG
jgi:transposase